MEPMTHLSLENERAGVDEAEKSTPTDGSFNTPDQPTDWAGLPLMDELDLDASAMGPLLGFADFLDSSILDVELDHSFS